MSSKSILSISVVFILTIMLVFGGLFTVNVLANDDNKIIGEYPNDGDLPGYVTELDSYKFEPIEPGTTTEYGVTIDVEGNGRLFDWDSESAIAYVFVKGGSSGYLYDYTPGSYSGMDLHAPLNPNGDYAGLSHITFYFAEVGSLTVNKEFLFDGHTVTSNDIDADFYFEVTVSGPSGYTSTQSGTGNQSLLFDNLVAGNYTVTETTSGAEWEVNINSQDVTVYAGENTDVNFTNNYIPGTLEVNKEFLFDGQIITTNDVEADFYFEVTVSGPLNYYVTKSGTGNQTLVFDNLAGGTYTITESTSGAEWEVNINSQEATVYSGDTSVVTFINNYIPGELEVTKEFLFDGQTVNLGDIDADFDFEITVTGTNYTETKTGSGNQTLLFDNLLAGIYTVTESSSGTEWLVDTTIKDATVTSGGLAEVAFTNNFIPGSLKVNKEFRLPNGDLANTTDMTSDFNFTINVTGPLGYSATKSGTGNVSLVFDNLVVGTYTVTETTSGAEWEVDVASQDADIVSDTETEITFINNYIPGELEVSKMFMFDGQTVNIGDIDADFNFEITVAGPNYSATKTGTGNQTLLFDNLLAGIYTVTETSSGVEWLVNTTNKDVTITSGGLAEVAFTNNFIPGSLKVNKEFRLPNGDLANTTDMTADFNFTINVIGPLGYSATKTGTGNVSLVFDNLVVGTYTVTETTSGAEWEVDVASQDADIVSNTETEITFTNHYVQGEIIVNKEFLLDGQTVTAEDIEADFYFEVTVTGPLGYNSTQSGTGNQSLVFSDLIAGIYTVTESTSGAEWQVDILTQETTVISGNTSEVNFINNYMIMSETAWAAHAIGEYRYNERGNWATYLVYNELDNGMADIYAGQKEYVGYVEFVENGNDVEIYVHLEDWAFEPNATNLYVQDYNKKPKGNPAPGRFDYKESISGYEASITVPLNEYYGIHLNVYEVK